MRGYVSDREGVDERTREIRQEIEETRGEMSETIDAIEEKLKPRNIVANATDRVKTAATERVREMADTASETAQHAMEYTRETAESMAGTARQNPIPLALIGVGTVWLLSRRSRTASWDGAGYRRERDYGREFARSYERTRDDDRYEDDSRGVMARIRSNPVPAALAGVGLGWLAFAGRERTGASNRSAYGSYGEQWGAGPTQARQTGENASGGRGMAESLTDSASEIA